MVVSDRGQSTHKVFGAMLDDLLREGVKTDIFHLLQTFRRTLCTPRDGVPRTAASEYSAWCPALPFNYALALACSTTGVANVVNQISRPYCAAF